MYQEELIVLRNGRKAPERSGEYWSKEDLETLQNLFWEGVNLSEIAIRLGRNEVATYQQLTKRGLLSGKGGGILDPGGSATRAEVAQILQNFLA